MKKILIIGLAILCVFLGVNRLLKERRNSPRSRSRASKSKSVEISFRGQEVEIVKGPQRYLLEASPEFTTDLRVFGYNPLPYGTDNDDKPLHMIPIITHVFIATSLESNKAIFEKYLCEQKAVDQASMLHVLVNDQKVSETIGALQNAQDSRKCARITGRNLRLKKYFFQGEDLTGTGEWSPTQFNFDPEAILLLSDIEGISCQ